MFDHRSTLADAPRSNRTSWRAGLVVAARFTSKCRAPALGRRAHAWAIDQIAHGCRAPIGHASELAAVPARHIKRGGLEVTGGHAATVAPDWLSQRACDLRRFDWTGVVARFCSERRPDEQKVARKSGRCIFVIASIQRAVQVTSCVAVPLPTYCVLSQSRHQNWILE